MSARARMYAIVGGIAAVAAGAVAGAIVLSSGGGGRAAAATPPGRPPLELDLGVRTDSEAQALRRAYGLYSHGQPKAAAAIFSRYRSLQAELGSAMAAWPDGTVDRLQQLAGMHPRSSVASLDFGIALYWSGRRDAAFAAWRAARKANPDTPAAVHADDLLHPGFNRGLPMFVPSFPSPTRISRLPAQQQLAALAREPGVRGKLLYGVALQRLGKPVSAEREFAAAARLGPNDPDAQVAAAVGRFDKDHPERAFSRLGPLTLRFPHASTVRFHLGLLLLWMGQVRGGTKELRLAHAEGPNTPLGREAGLFLERLKLARNK